MTIFTLIIRANKKNNVALGKVLYIYFLFCFHKNKNNKIWILINFDNKINAMTPIYIFKLDLKTQHTNVETQKIEDSIFKIFEIVLISF